MGKHLRVATGAFLAFCLISGGAACSSDTPPPEEPEIRDEYEQLITDPDFAEGINITGLRSHAMESTAWLYSNTVNTTYGPYWTLGQYCDLSSTREGYDSSVNDLSLGTLFDESKGIEGREGNLFTLTNRSGSKYIVVDSSTGEVEMNIDTTKEYVDQTTGDLSPRRSGEDWVHMILQQTTRTVYLAKADRLEIELEFAFTALDMIEDRLSTASQFQWIFGIHDRGSAIDDYMWFNLTIYDNRYEVFPGTQMYDGGKEDATGKFIYAPSSKQIFGDGFTRFTVGEKYKIRLDLLPFMKQAFDTAQEKGALAGAQWANMAFNGFNLGWEVTNVAKAGVHIYDLSLTAVTEGGIDQ